MNQSRSLSSIIGFTIAAALFAGMVWGNYQFSKMGVSGPGFSIQWIAIRSLVTTGISPYSVQVKSQIQGEVFAETSFAGGTRPEYTSPLFSGVMVLPFALIPYTNLAHALWMTLQLAAILLTLLIGLRLTDWKPVWYIFLAFSLFTMLSYHALIPWLDGGLSVLAAFFLSMTFLMIFNHWYEVGGMFLALSAVQPQMTILVIVFVLLWAGAQKKRVMILWFFITLIITSILGLFLVPDWIMQYLRILFNYPSHFSAGSPALLFMDLWPGLGKQLGWLLIGTLLIILAIEWWLARRKDFRWFLWTVCLTIVISQWIGIPTIPANFSGLILPLILVAAMLTERWPRGGQWSAIVISLILLGWEWALYYLDVTGSQPAMQLNLIIPLPLILLVGLYWVRWWAIRPRRFMLEEVRFGEAR